MCSFEKKNPSCLKIRVNIISPVKFHCLQKQWFYANMSKAVKFLAKTVAVKFAAIEGDT